jgi:hypothetical protein
VHGVVAARRAIPGLRQQRCQAVLRWSDAVKWSAIHLDVNMRPVRVDWRIRPPHPDDDLPF